MHVLGLIFSWTLLGLGFGQNDPYRWQRQMRKPIVRVRQGLIEGTPMYLDNSKIANVFLGIPYATAPVGQYRFAPPQRHLGWNGTYQANDTRSHCPQLPKQPNQYDSEDCLYLNIWAPNLDQYSQTVPVVVVLEGKDFAKSTNEARGNMGLLDQYYALVWVRENIAQFGGDPERITILGHGSGGASVGFHMASPRTSGLFNRAVILTGSIVAPWHTINDPIQASKEVLRLLGCTTYTLDALACIKSKGIEEILQAYQEYSESTTWTDQFLPIVDDFLPEINQYLPEHPTKILREGAYLKVPILAGLTRPIADSQYSEWIDLASQGFGQLQQYVEKAKVPEIMRLYRFGTFAREEMFAIIKWKYASQSVGDVRVLFNQMKQLEFEAKQEAPFYLQLTYLMSNNPPPIYVSYLDDIGISVNTTDNLASTDMLLLFGTSLLQQTGRRRFSPTELKLSSHIQEAFTNFVLYGNPTPSNSRLKPWRTYRTDDPYIETFDTFPNADLQRRNEVLFWNQLLPKIANIRNALSNNIPSELQNSPDPAAGFRHALYILVCLVVALLCLLLICMILLKRRSKERDRKFPNY